MPAGSAVDPAAVRASEIALIRASGVFDAVFYNQTYPDAAASGIDPVEHFYDTGVGQDKRPNFYFEPSWYLREYSDVAASGQNPLLHFIVHGDAEGRNPGPLFVTHWYREIFKPAPGEMALAHYLRNCKSGIVSPYPDFDIEYYANTNPDVITACVDPFQHFVSYGYKEWRNPSPDFDIYFYIQRYLADSPDVNPFFHWLENRHKPGVFGRMPEDEASIPREVKKFTRPSRYFEEYKPVPRTAPRRAKVLAYYLPQFHAFAENDEWWGKGFTEWSNIPRGVPRFAGHYQPRVPRDLGYYTLDNPEIMRRQAELARNNGIHGFVFYHYWFNGKRLMESPVERFLADATIDMPFALMWANENWTRRWDGSESDVLISQDYLAEDHERLVADFARHFRDPRYIRIGGRPFLAIYRPGVIPDCAETIARWRRIFEAEYNESPLIFMVQAFGDTDPRLFGCDAALEFPPHKLTHHMLPANRNFTLLDMEFTGKIYHYEDVVRESLDEPAPPYPLVKAAVPSWDNDARRQGDGLVITGSTPAAYGAWLAELVARAEQAPCVGEPLVCVNAWNEWCEGTYLEPDLHFGAAYLNATGRAVCGIGSSAAAVPKLLLVGHDAFPSGAQHLLLNIGRVLTKSFGLKVEFLLLGGGKLEPLYKQVGPTLICANAKQLKAQLGDYSGKGFTHAIVNTSAAARIVPDLRQAGMEAVLLVHELPRLLKEKGLVEAARAGLAGANAVVFPAQFVQDAMFALLDRKPAGRELIQPQGSYKSIAADPEKAAAFRSMHSIGTGAPMVLGMGYADLRKGFDLFLQLWRALNGDGTRQVHLCWVGGIDPGLRQQLQDDIERARDSGTFHMIGYMDDVVPALSAADVFVLTSREDPFPTVVMEAVAAGLPVVAFAQSGGMPEVIAQYDFGSVVAHGDCQAMAGAVQAFIAQGHDAAAAAARQRVLQEHFSFRRYVERLLRLAMPGLPRVSVAVPNYNYACYMAERLGSIFRQTHPVCEIIVLDDKSTDDSLAVIPAIAADWDREVTLVPNEVNSGSVFAQWRKAAELATGDWIWIAEADDASEPGFLDAVMSVIASDGRAVMGFSDSRTLHADGSPQWPSYKGYYDMVEPGALAHVEVFAAEDFVQRFLSVKNLMLNASAVVWRRDVLLRTLQLCEAELKSYKMAGDWRLYLQALSIPGARIAYHSSPLNVHRRHASSVTHALAVEKHLAEIRKCHMFVRKAFSSDSSLEKKQDKYLAEVAADLGFTGGGAA